MLKVTSETLIFVATQPLDCRKGLDRTLASIQQTLLKNPRSGAYFVFFNRSRTLARLVCYDGSGYWLATKRLSRGTFATHPSSSSGVTSMTGQQLLELLEGVWQSARHDKKACA